MKNFPSRYEGLGNRLRYIIEYKVPTKGRFGWLEEQTGIPRGTWQTFFRRSTSTPGGDMIQAVSRLFPRYAFWLASGLTDQAFGHTYPQHSDAKCFPEYPSKEDQKRFDDYFGHCMTMQMQVYDGNTRQGDGDAQQDARERLQELARLRRIELEMLHAEEEKRAADRAERIIKVQQ